MCTGWYNNKHKLITMHQHKNTKIKFLLDFKIFSMDGWKERWMEGQTDRWSVESVETQHQVRR
jgi:hypothetical protein